VLVVPIIFASNVSQWLGIFLIGLAAAAHQGWSANLYTVCSDMFPKNTVASIVGLGSTIGAIGSMSFAVFAGFVLPEQESSSLKCFSTAILPDQGSIVRLRGIKLLSQLFR